MKKSIFKYFILGVKTTINILSKSSKYLIDGLVVVSYMLYNIVKLPFDIGKKTYTIAEKKHENKIVIKEKKKKDLQLEKQKQLEEQKLRILEEKKAEEEYKIAELERKQIEKQKVNVNQKSKADIKLEKRYKEQKKIEFKKKQTEEKTKKIEEINEEKKKKLLAKIEAKSEQLKFNEEQEIEKNNLKYNNLILDITEKINDVNNRLKDQQLTEKQKGELALKRSKLESSLEDFKFKKKNEEEKIYKKYKSKRDKETINAKLEKEKLEELIKQEKEKLKKQTEKENEFINSFSKKNKKNKKNIQNTEKIIINNKSEEQETKEEQNKLNFFEKIYQNTKYAKEQARKREISRQALISNFEKDDGAKSDVKLAFEYVAKRPDGKVVKDCFFAFSKIEVHSYLLSEGYTVYSIRTNKWIQFLYSLKGKTRGTKVKISDVIFMCTQLSTYIKAGIPLVESIRILSKQYKRKDYVNLFTNLMYDLTMGDNFSDALSKQGNAFPSLLINMVRASELTGELPEALDDMADYYTNTEATRKQMITAMTYPLIVTVVAGGVMIFVMMYVIPKFVEIYNSMEGIEIPAFTQAIINLSDWLKAYFLYLILGIIIVIGVLIYLYKNVKSFRETLQYTAMRLPVFGNIIIYNEVTMFTKTFASLLKHNVFITDSMEILNKISNNEIYKSLISDTIVNLSKGEKISAAFEDQWAFPIAAYEMIVTGEKTGQLAEMMDKVSSYYQELHRNAVGRIKTFIEPIMIVGLTLATGVIVLAVIIPMFNMYSSLSEMSNTQEQL